MLFMSHFKLTREANMGIEEKLSLECRNRISIWSSMLQKASNYLVIWENIWDNVSSIPPGLDCWYEIEGRTFRFQSSLTIAEGMLEAAVIWFCNIFANGKEGTGIANNYDEDIKIVRKEMLEYTSKNLDISMLVI